MYDFYAQNSATVVNPSYQIYTYISIWSLLLFTIKDGQSCWELPIQQRGKTIDPHKTKCVGIFRRKKKSLLSFLLIHIPRLGKQKLLWIEKDINLYDTFRLDCSVFPGNIWYQKNEISYIDYRLRMQLSIAIIVI